MRILPWLIAISRGRRAVAGAIVLAVVGVVAGLYVAGGLPAEQAPDHATVEAVDLDLRLNDEMDWPDGPNGTVRSCLASGTPGDRVGVYGEVSVHLPTDIETDPHLAIELSDLARTRTVTLADRGQITHDVFWLLEDDETVSVGDWTTVVISIRSSEETLASTNRSVIVENDSRTYECE